jgi:hypothetical protein
MNMKSIVLGVSIILIAVLTMGIVAVYIHGDEGTNTMGEKGQSYSLVHPVFGQNMATASTFLDNEAGISLYVNLDRPIDLIAAKAANWSGIELETADYIVGSLHLPGLGAEDDVHCFVHDTGWIVTYYGDTEPLSKIVDWNLWSQSTSKLTTNKLKAGLNEFSFLGPLPVEKYYHFKWPNATKCMLAFRTLAAGGEHSFNITIPSDITVYERSWSHYALRTYLAWSFSSTSNFAIDGTTISTISGREDPVTNRGTLTDAYLYRGTAHNVSVSNSYAHSYLHGVCIGLVYQEP